VAARDRLAARLQAELGPTDYDWSLYANERENRVAVAAVPSDAAKASGLRAGDVIFSYAGQRIFTPHDWRRARGLSAADGPVAARVVRGTVWIDVELPGDSLEALGFRLETRRERPAELLPARFGGLAGRGS
jgi:S1-C subfamily serine protease